MVKLTISVHPEAVTQIQQMAAENDRSVSNMARHLLNLGINAMHQYTGKGLNRLPDTQQYEGVRVSNVQEWTEKDGDVR